jgi:hypothetical protein
MAETSTPAIQHAVVMDQAEQYYREVRTFGGAILDIQNRAHKAEADGQSTYETIMSIEFPLTALRKQFKDALSISGDHYDRNEDGYYQAAVELATQEGYQINV